MAKDFIRTAKLLWCARFVIRAKATAAVLLHVLERVRNSCWIFTASRARFVPDLARKDEETVLLSFFLKPLLLATTMRLACNKYKRVLTVSPLEAYLGCHRACRIVRVSCVLRRLAVFQPIHVASTERASLHYL